MANELIIAGTTYKELAGAWSGETGISGPMTGAYYATGEFGNPPYEGPPEYQDLEITLPGVDGIGIKRMGFRGRMIFVRMAFVGETKSLCEVHKKTFFEAVTPLASFTIRVPGGLDRPSCRFVVGSGTTGQWTYMAGQFVMLVDVAFKQCRLV